MTDQDYQAMLEYERIHNVDLIPLSWWDELILMFSFVGPKFRAGTMIQFGGTVYQIFPREKRDA